MSKQPFEEQTFTYDFADALGVATISSVTSAVSDPRGAGTNMTVAAGPTISGTDVLVRWAGGVDGEDYLTTVKIVASDGEKHELDGVILVRERGFELLSLAEVKQHLRVTHDDEDALIQGYMAAALATVDGPGGWLARSLSVQTIVYRRDSFGTCPIRLPYEPVISIDSVEHIDSDGAWQEVDDADYELDNGYLQPVWDGSWPSTGWRKGAVRITYQAGYEVLPAEVRQGLLLKVESYYRRAADPTYSKLLDDRADSILHIKRVFA